MELLPHTLSLLSPFPLGHDGDARGNLEHDMATMDAELPRGDSGAPTAESPAQPQQPQQQQQQEQQGSSGAAVPLTAAQQQQQGMSFRRLATHHTNCIAEEGLAD